MRILVAEDDPGLREVLVQGFEDSGYHVDSNGQLSLFTTAFTDKGTTDLTVSPDGAFLYADTGASGIVDGFAVNTDGTLNALTSVVVPGGADLEGIVAI